MSSGSADRRGYFWTAAHDNPWDVYGGIDYGLIAQATSLSLRRMLTEPIANDETRAFIRTQLALRILAESIEEQS